MEHVTREIKSSSPEAVFNLYVERGGELPLVSLRSLKGLATKHWSNIAGIVPDFWIETAGEIFVQEVNLIARR